MKKQKSIWLFALLGLALSIAYNYYFSSEEQLTDRFHNELLLGSKADLNKVQKLINQGADVEAPYQWGDNVYSPLSVTVLFGNKKAADVLINNGADVNQVVAGKTVLDIACENGSVEFIELLVRYDAVTNQYVRSNAEKDISPYCK